MTIFGSQRVPKGVFEPPSAPTASTNLSIFPSSKAVCSSA
jgi:hypothetical protein